MIPHLNQPDLLGSCLEALQRQDFDMSRVEIIVVDNGSRCLPDGVTKRFANVTLIEEAVPDPDRPAIVARR